jgi:hypothetical protein
VLTGVRRQEATTSPPGRGGLGREAFHQLPRARWAIELAQGMPPASGA